MKYLHLLTILVATNLCFGQGMAEHHPKRILVKFNDAALLSNVDLKSNTFHISKLDELNSRNIIESIVPVNPGNRNDTYVLEFKYPVDISATIYKYYDTRFFEFVEPDYLGYGGGEIVPNDGQYKRQWALHNDGSFDLGPTPKPGADIDMQKAWDITTGSDDIIIAILDSGLKLDHPEFSGRLWVNESGAHGRDYANGDSDPSDDLGHGTNVTGILSANSDNDMGFAGVNWKSKLMIMKILDYKNTGFYSWWSTAIYYAVDNGARVINMSVGGSSYSAVMEDAVNFATSQGVIVIACMMNENNSKNYYPAAYENTIAVGATNPDDTRADEFPWDPKKGSNFGEHIDISAPGNFIYGLHFNDDNYYDVYWSGTSQATPFVSGVVSLLLSLDPDLTLESVRSILSSSADDQVGRPFEDVEGFDEYHGHGRLNAFNALNTISSASTTSVQNGLSFKISPNPIRKGDNLHLQFKSQQERIVSIFDSSGRLIAMNKTGDLTYTINSSNLETGAYILKIQEKGRAMGSSKFIVEK